MTILDDADADVGMTPRPDEDFTFRAKEVCEGLSPEPLDTAANNGTRVAELADGANCD